jgi:dienelactone hydrolase
VKTISREERIGYVVEKFMIDNEVDGWIPGYLAIPTNVKGKVPVIVGLHGHSSSKESIFGTGLNTSQDVLAPLIASGYAVMAIDSYFNGDRRGLGPAGTNEMQERRSDQELSQFKLNLWFGRSLWGMMLRDEQIALDYLVTRPEIDAERIGIEGMSMGSTRSWWLAALDDRVKAVVGVACFTRYKELIEQRQLRAHGIYYFVPGMLNHFDTEAVMGLIAPRPFLVLTGDSDLGSPLDGMYVLEDKLKMVYALYKKDDNFKSIIYENTGHVYTDQMKLEMLQWFDKYLK